MREAFATLIGLLMVIAATGYSQPSQAAGPTWVYVLSWSPQYCYQHTISKEPQCTEGNDFLPQTLAPEGAFPKGTYPRNQCPPAQVTEDQLERPMLLTRNRQELVDSWLQNGGCTGLAFGDFSIKLDFATRKVALPEAYRDMAQRLATTMTDIRAEFLKANPGMRERGIALHCAGGGLSEVRVCLNENLGFRECGPTVKDDCGEKVLMRSARPGPRER